MTHSGHLPARACRRDVAVLVGSLRKSSINRKVANALNSKSTAKANKQ